MIERLLIKGRDIILGWYFRVVKNIDIEKLSEERMAICNECEELDLKGDKCAFPGTQPCCGECGCPLASNTRSPYYTCPKFKW